MEAIMQKLALLIGVFVLLTLGLYTVVVPNNAIAQNIACYRMQGGAKNVAASGCEYEFRSGSTFDIQDGTTFSISDLTLTDDLNVTGDLVVTGTSNLQGNVSDSAGVFTFADNVLVDGQADAVQLTVQGYTTQTNAAFVVENSSGTDLVTVSNTGLLTADDVTSVDDITVGDDLGVGGWGTFTKQSTTVVSDGSTITPLGTYAPISATATTGTSDIANPTAGRVLLIVNVGSATITLTDTGTLKLGGNAALGQYDTLSLLGDGTNWVQLSKADN
jgi:hypothetical protein